MVNSRWRIASRCHRSQRYGKAHTGTAWCAKTQPRAHLRETGLSTPSEGAFASGIATQSDGAGCPISHPLNGPRRSGKFPPWTRCRPRLPSSSCCSLAGSIDASRRSSITCSKRNRVLRAVNGSRRLRLTDDQRRRLAVKGQVLGRRHLAAVAGIVTPDTILRWYRRLVAVRAFMDHYHEERPQQGLGNDLIAPTTALREPGAVRCRERLGGVLKFYYRAAA